MKREKTKPTIPTTIAISKTCCIPAVKANATFAESAWSAVCFKQLLMPTDMILTATAADVPHYAVLLSPLLAYSQFSQLSLIDLKKKCYVTIFSLLTISIYNIHN
ncbi:hypothetical protein AV654_04275 [Paenibacillus elgii]|uniref:Uncharacterized protein n=1 Tax=Paenibacillus elgii TaxID=189691 RepID=A0A165PW50_9BACL|nr:hypothetical protein AV654_04275 [Paenibacillus elgii]